MLVERCSELIFVCAYLGEPWPLKLFVTSIGDQHMSRPLQFPEILQPGPARAFQGRWLYSCGPQGWWLVLPESTRQQFKISCHICANLPSALLGTCLDFSLSLVSHFLLYFCDWLSLPGCVWVFSLHEIDKLWGSQAWVHSIFAVLKIHGVNGKVPQQVHLWLLFHTDTSLLCVFSIFLVGQDCKKKMYLLKLCGQPSNRACPCGTSVKHQLCITPRLSMLTCLSQFCLLWPTAANLGEGLLCRGMGLLGALPNIHSLFTKFSVQPWNT